MRPAECLSGLDLSGGWTVISIVDRSSTATGGNFSVGYSVKDRDGNEAYLKALDFSMAFNHPDFTRALENLTKAYNFECDLLEQCRDRKLRRVVTPLSKGTVKVPGDFGPLGNVAYLIFEKATGDIRNEVEKWSYFDVAWALRSLHQSAIGLQELHLIGIAHQDVKPSNILVFDNIGTKVSDLGRASHKNISSEPDTFQIPGDPGYATPESIYGWHLSSEFASRFMTDLYHLGSLIYFFFLSCSATSAIQTKLSQKHHKAFTRSSFIQDLPYIQQAFGEVIDELYRSVEVLCGDMTEEIVMIAKQLCEPDPRFRGDPAAIAATHRPQHDLQPYISRFANLARNAEMRML